MSIEIDLSRNIVTIASFYLQNNDFQSTLRFQYYRDNTLGHFKIEDQVCRETYLLTYSEPNQLLHCKRILVKTLMEVLFLAGALMEHFLDRSILC